MIPRRRVPIDAARLARAWFDSRKGVDDAVAQFESSLAAFTGRRDAVAACSGRAALVATLHAAGLEPGDEVILPAYTLADLPRLLLKHGLQPVFADIDPATLLLDPAAALAAIGPRTRAMVPADMFGLVGRWDDWLGPAAAKHGLTLIEDAAHALGSLIDGAPAGKNAPLVFFSLETIKVFHSFGGGVVVMDDPAMAASIRGRLPTDAPASSYLLKKFSRNVVENVAFRTPLYQLALTGMDHPKVRSTLLGAYERVRSGGTLVQSAYSPWQAAYADSSLRAVPQRIERRRLIADRIIEELSDRLEFIEEPPGVVGNRYFLVARTDRDLLRLRQAMVRRGVDLGIGNELTDFCPPAKDIGRFPHAAQAHQTLIQLPLFEGMTDRQIRRIVQATRQGLDDATF